MKIEIKGVKINYKTYGSGSPVIVLHGWGADISSMQNVIDVFAEDYKVYAIDLPGFGLSEKLDNPWDLYDYEDCVTRFIQSFELENVILVGHSFGGSIALCIAYNRVISVRSLFLIDAAGIRKDLSREQKFRVYTFKAFKAFVNILPIMKKKKQKMIDRVKNKVGSSDYNEAKGVMRDTLVRVVNHDIRDILEKIITPTVLIWGENDKSTPLEHGKIMNGLIRESKLRIIDGAGHFPFIDDAESFTKILKEEVRRIK